jgi:hypothetical protein
MIHSVNAQWGALRWGFTMAKFTFEGRVGYIDENASPAIITWGGATFARDTIKNGSLADAIDDALFESLESSLAEEEWRPLLLGDVVSSIISNALRPR